MTEFDLSVECPHCGAAFTVPRIRAGSEEACPVCSGRVRVPGGIGEGADEEAPDAPEAEVDESVEEALPEAEQEEWTPQPPPEVAEGAGNCCVCLADEHRVNVLAVGPVVGSFTGLARRDARAQVTHGMGVLAKHLAPDTALRMVAALKGKGVAAFAVPEREAPAISKRVAYTHVRGADEGALRVEMDKQGAVTSLAWPAIVACVASKDKFGGKKKAEAVRETYVTFYAGGMGATPVVRHSAPQRRMKEEPAPLLLTLLLRDAQRRLHAMVVQESKVLYAYLGERLLPSRDMNFELFLGDVARWASRAFQPESFREAAAGRSLRVRETAGKVEYENYLRWAVCCAAARGLLG